MTTMSAEYRKMYYLKNRERIRARQRAYDAAHTAQRSERQRAYYATPEGKKIKDAAHNRWLEKNRAYWNAKQALHARKRSHKAGAVPRNFSAPR